MWNGIHFLTFDSVYDLVYDWYVLSMQRMTKNDCNWKCLIRFACSGICVNKKLVHGLQTGYHHYVQYQRPWEMTIFGLVYIGHKGLWYT